MSKITKWVVVGLLDGMGLSFFLIGAMTHAYPTATGLIIMLAFLWIAGMLMYILGLVEVKDNYDTLF